MIGSVSHIIAHLMNEFTWNAWSVTLHITAEPVASLSVRHSRKFQLPLPLHSKWYKDVYLLSICLNKYGAQFYNAK